jgi:hypothetical protein
MEKAELPPGHMCGGGGVMNLKEIFLNEVETKEKYKGDFERNA